MKENVVKIKSFAFAIRVVKLYQFLCEQKREFVLSKQLLRCGTSVGAMVREVQHAESKLDFKHKMAIAQKEINETIYWLELLKETEYLTNEHATEIIKLITTIIQSSNQPKPTSTINH